MCRAVLVYNRNDTISRSLCPRMRQAHCVLFTTTPVAAVCCLLPEHLFWKRLSPLHEPAFLRRRHCITRALVSLSRACESGMLDLLLLWCRGPKSRSCCLRMRLHMPLREYSLLPVAHALARDRRGSGPCPHGPCVASPRLWRPSSISERIIWHLAPLESVHCAAGSRCGNVGQCTLGGGAHAHHQRQQHHEHPQQRERE